MMKNIRKLFYGGHEARVLSVLLLALFNTIDTISQSAGSHDSYDQYTDAQNWDFTVDDDNTSDGRTGFNWWTSGGNNWNQLMMQLSSNKIQNKLYFNLSLFGSQRIAKSTELISTNYLRLEHLGRQSAIESYGDIDGMHIASKTGNKIYVGDDNDEVKIKGKLHTLSTGLADVNSLKLIANYDNNGANEDIIFGFKGDFNGFKEQMRLTDDGRLGIRNSRPLVALDVDGDVIMNHGTGETLTKVSVNTDSNVENATITIAGSTYIGPQAEKASTGELSKFKAEYLDNFNLWVEDGIVTEDIVIVQVDNWKDDVFADDYKLKTFDELEKYIQNNRHLPGVKSEKLVKKEGYSIQEMNVSLLEKVEELFLYIIAQEKRIKQLDIKLSKLEKMMLSNQK